MEPLSAIGLASGIITFIDFSWKIVSGTIEVYESCQGATKENVRISTIINDLKDYADQLVSDSSSRSKQERALEQLAAQCSEVADELIRKLEELKAKKNSRWQSFKSTWMAMRKEKDIASIERRLGEYRAQISQRLIALLCEKQSHIRFQLEMIQNEAEKVSSASVREMRLLREEIVDMLSVANTLGARDDTSSSEEDDGTDEEQHRVLLDSLHDIKRKLVQLEATASRMPRETRVLQHLYFNHMSSRKYSIDKPAADSFSWILQNDRDFRQFCDTGVFHSSADHLDENSLSSETDHEIGDDGKWESLDEDIEDKVDSDTSKQDYTRKSDNTRGRSPNPTYMSEEYQTSSWLKCNGIVAKMDEARRVLINWLENGSEAFHISGRPGSGKSTLMKMICEHQRTVECLERWASRRALALASFFFWTQGSDELQKSLRGLYRAILFSILRECPQLIPEVFPHQWEKLSTVSANLVYETDLFSPPKIKRAFELLMSGSSLALSNFCFCLFIDGLDEYQGSAFERREFAQHLRDWARLSNIKICVSSREQVEFMYVFSPQLRIRLQDVTELDIYRVTCFLFRKAECFSRLKKIYIELVREILNMAQGVFFWAVLVVKSIVNEAFICDDPQKLRQKLYDTPKELDELYDHMLNSLDRADRKWADLALLLTLTNPFRTEMNAMCLSWIDDVTRPGFPRKSRSYSPANVRERVEVINKTLQVRTKGLLVLHEEAESNVEVLRYPFFSTRVHFFHRTVHDYLADTNQRNRLEAQYPNLDFLHTHSLLRLAEVSFFETGDLDSLKDSLEMYAMEAYVLKSPSIETLRPRYLQILRDRDIWNNLWMRPAPAK